MGVDASIQGVPNFDKLQIVKVGYIDVIKAASTVQGEGIVNHNLGYKPVTFVYLDYYDEAVGQTYLQSMPQVSVNTADGTTNNYYDWWVTETQIAARITTPSSSSNYTDEITERFKYYLCREAAS